MKNINNNSVFISKNVSNQIKGIAIFIVILHHFSLFKIINFMPLEHIGVPSVMLFLIISGYGITSSYLRDCKLENYFYKRFKKVMLPYIVVILLQILFARYVLKQTFSLTTIILSLIGMDLNRTIDGTMWFISFIVIWYIAFYIIFRLPVKNWIKLLLLFTISYLLKYQSFSFSASWQFKQNAYSFPIGVMMALYFPEFIKLINKLSFKKSNDKIMYILLSIVFSVCFYLYYINNYQALTENSYLIAGILFSLAIIYILKFLEICNLKIILLTRIGNISYEMYLFEGAFLWNVKLYSLLGFHSYTHLIYFVLLLASSILLQKFVLLLFCMKDIIVYKFYNLKV